MNKQSLRELLREQRDRLTDIEGKSHVITEHLIKASYFIHAKSVFLYRSFCNEVMTDELWNICKNEGKKCLFPKCISAACMIAAEVRGASDFSLSSFGILEPVSKKAFPKEEIDLIIVPGLGFDRMGFRIGYGGGYYDRYLADYTGVSVGLCYEELLCDTVFPDPHDIRVSHIVTQRGILS